MKRFEVLDHTADIDIIVHGEDLKTLFENAGEPFLLRKKIASMYSLFDRGLIINLPAKVWYPVTYIMSQ